MVRSVWLVVGFDLALRAMSHRGHVGSCGSFRLFGIR